MSRWIWIIGLFLLVIIGGAVGIGFYLAHDNTTDSVPEAIGGSANDGSTPLPQPVNQAPTISSSLLHVSPTNTVARRDSEVVETPLPMRPRSLHQPYISHKHGHRVQSH